jgi:hypothetical protein
VTIDRGSPVPFYFQLAELLQGEIVHGRLKPSARLPSEPELCEEYSLSRTTLRSSEGFFQEEVDRLGRRVTSEVLRAGRDPFPRWACRALELPLRSTGATLVRLRLNGHIAFYVVNHLVEELADAALAISNPNESLYRRLKERPQGRAARQPPPPRGDRGRGRSRRAPRVRAARRSRSSTPRRPTRRSATQPLTVHMSRNEGRRTAAATGACNEVGPIAALVCACG